MGTRVGETSQFRLTGQQRMAAERLAENEFALKGEKRTYEQIAKEVGITPRQLYNWRKVPDFNSYMTSISTTIFNSYTPLAEAQLINAIRGTSSNGIASSKALDMFFRMSGRFVDRSEITHTDSNSPRMTQDELRDKIADLDKHFE